MKKHVPVSRRISGRAPRSCRIVFKCRRVHRGSTSRHALFQSARRRRVSKTRPAPLARHRRTPSTNAVSHSATAICACTCECRSGGPVSEPDGLTHTRALPPAASAKVTGIQSRRACPSGAVQRAGIHTWAAGPEGISPARCPARWPAPGARPFRRAAPACPRRRPSDPPPPPARARRSGTPRSARRPWPPRPGRCAAAAGCGPSRASGSGASASSSGCCAPSAVSVPDQGWAGATASWAAREAGHPAVAGLVTIRACHDTLGTDLQPPGTWFMPGGWTIPGRYPVDSRPGTGHDVHVCGFPYPPPRPIACP